MFIVNLAKKGYIAYTAECIFCHSYIALSSPKLDNLLQAMLK